MAREQQSSFKKFNMFKDPDFVPTFERAKRTFIKLSRYKIMRKSNVDTHHLLSFGLVAFLVLTSVSHLDQVALAFAPDKTLANVDHLIARADALLNENPAMSILAKDEQLKPFAVPIYQAPTRKKGVALASQIIKVVPTKDANLNQADATVKRIAKISPFKRPSRGFFESSGEEEKAFQLVMPVKDFIITSRYGWRHGRPHRGLDLSAPIGTTVYAAEEGTVIMAEPYYGYGNLVVVDHGNGVKTRYAHLSKMFVSEGAKVFKDQMIGAIGMTGNSTGPHLHFEVTHNSVHQNPELFLLR